MELVSYFSWTEALQLGARLIAIGVLWWLTSISEGGAKKLWIAALVVAIGVTIVGAIITYGEASSKQENDRLYSCHPLSYSYNPAKCKTH